MPTPRRILVIDDEENVRKLPVKSEEAGTKCRRNYRGRSIREHFCRHINWCSWTS
jgi:hypothetical protein